MSADADAFMKELMEAGITPVRNDEVFDENDQPTEFEILEAVREFVVPPVERVKLFRDSEHYFSLSVRLKNGTLLEWPAPIRKAVVITPERANLDAAFPTS